MDNSNLPKTDEAVTSAVFNGDVLSVVIKVSERCNLACPYCYFFFNGDETHQEHPPFVSLEIVREVVKFIRRAVEQEGIRYVRVGLHGGEPLLLKKAKFAEICEILRDGLDPVCNLSLMVQTNGVLVNREWIELFSRYKIRVGVSIDGDEAVHNIFRITKKGAGTYAETRRGWNMLNQAMADGEIPSVGILCVISPKQSGAAVYKHLVQELKAGGVNFLLPDLTHDAPELTQEFVDGCGNFLIDMFNAWSESRGPNGLATVRLIHETIGPLINDDLCQRSVSKYKPLNSFGVSSNGELSPDDVARGVAPRFRGLEYRIGKQQYDELRASPPWQELEQTQQKLPSACQSCIWRNICRGGTYQSRYSEKNGFDNPSIFCSALKRFYSHVTKQVVAAGYPLEEIERRLETEFERI